MAIKDMKITLGSDYNKLVGVITLNEEIENILKEGNPISLWPSLLINSEGNTVVSLALVFESATCGGE